MSRLFGFGLIKIYNLRNMDPWVVDAIVKQQGHAR